MSHLLHSPLVTPCGNINLGLHIGSGHRLLPDSTKPSPEIMLTYLSSMRSGFEISLVLSSETSKNDSRTSGIPAGLVRRTTAYFWFSHKLHWLYIFQTSEWYFRTSDFYNPLARRTSVFNLKFWSLEIQWFSSESNFSCDNSAIHQSLKSARKLCILTYSQVLQGANE